MQSLYVLDSGAFSLKYNCSLKHNKKHSFADLKEHKYAEPLRCDASACDKFSRACAHIFREENVEAVDEDLALLILLDTLTTPKEREMLLHASFERFGATRASLVYSAATTLYSAGETSGACVDLGYSGVRISTIFNSVSYPTLCTSYASVGGHCVDEAIARRHGSGCSDDVLEAVKKQQCFLGETSNGGGGSELTLPDGASFTSSLTAEDAKSAAQHLLYSKTVNLPRSLCLLMESASIQFASPQRYVLAGHGANLKGISSVFSDALAHSMLPTLPKSLYLKNPQWAAVEGGTILSQLSTFKTMCIEKGEYEEEGPARCTYGKVVDPR